MAWSDAARAAAKLARKSRQTTGARREYLARRNTLVRRMALRGSMRPANEALRERIYRARTRALRSK